MFISMHVNARADPGFFDGGGGVHIYKGGVRFVNFTGLFMGPPGVLGIWGEWLFIFRELGSTGNYFRGAREQAHTFGDLGSLAKKQKKIRKSLHFV